MVFDLTDGGKVTRAFPSPAPCSDFGDSGDWRQEDTRLLAPDDFRVNGPWPHSCQGLQGTDSMYAYPTADGRWAALVGTSHQETPNPWPLPSGGKWPVSHATAPTLMGPWTRTNPSGGDPADAPCLNITQGYNENPIVTRRPDDSSAFQAVYDLLNNEGQGFGYACSATGGMDWEPGVLVAVPGGCRTPFGIVPVTPAEAKRLTPLILAYGAINATQVNAPNTQLNWLFYTKDDPSGWEAFHAGVVQLSW